MCVRLTHLCCDVCPVQVDADELPAVVLQKGGKQWRAGAAIEVRPWTARHRQGASSPRLIFVLLLCLRAGGLENAGGARQEGQPFPPHVRWNLCGHAERGKIQVLMAWGLALWKCGLFLHG